MSFTTPIFLFFFLPICIFLYFIADRVNIDIFKRLRIKDVLLIAMSFAFYGWACFHHVFILFFYIVIVYFLGLLITLLQNHELHIPVYKKTGSGKTRTIKVFSSALLIIIPSISALVFYLARSKYTNFIIDSVNLFFRTGYESKMIVSILGISFITFSAISYLADIYKRKAASGSFIDCLLYMTFFPKIVSGPIVLWRDFHIQTKEHKMSLQMSVKGINRICIGFAKKVLLADMFGLYILNITEAAENGIDSVTAWFSVLLYMLQIYYDFAGYSDIATGISNILGFEFKDNFNFPYRSCSITEFWRRWHISLGTWFREYVYIPLGGNRCGKRRTICNLAVVFALTGIWHGASWTYLIWGFINGAFVILERMIKDCPFYKKTPNFVKWISTMLIVMAFWELFRFESIKDCANWLILMFSGSSNSQIPAAWQYFIDYRIIFVTVCGILGATVLGSPRIIRFHQKVMQTGWGYALEEVGLLLLFTVSIVAMVSSSYSPFIYFQY